MRQLTTLFPSEFLKEHAEELGELYGLPDETIGFVQNYHAEYGQHSPEDETIDLY